MGDPKILPAFRQIDVLKEFSPQSQNILLSFSSIRAIRKGETLFCQGEPSPYCFGILSGEIKLIISGATPSSRICAAGCFLGGSSLVQEMPRAGLALVHLDGELLSIWSSRFRNWNVNSPEKATALQEIQRHLASYPEP